MTDDRNTYDVKVKYDYDEGTLEINIPEIIADLDEEDRKSLAQLHTFESAMWEEIKNAVKRDFTTSTYSPYVHQLRIELLAGDGADEVLKKTVRGILHDLEHAKKTAKRYRDSYFQLRRWVFNNITHDQRQSVPKEIEWERIPSIRDEDVDKAIAEAQREVHA